MCVPGLCVTFLLFVFLNVELMRGGVSGESVDVGEMALLPLSLWPPFLSAPWTPSPSPPQTGPDREAPGPAPTCEAASETPAVFPQLPRLVLVLMGEINVCAFPFGENGMSLLLEIFEKEAHYCWVSHPSWTISFYRDSTFLTGIPSD